MQAERISCLERQLQDSTEALEDESTHHQADMASIHQKLQHLISCMQVSVLNYAFSGSPEIQPLQQTRREAHPGTVCARVFGALILAILCRAPHDDESNAKHGMHAATFEIDLFDSLKQFGF